MKINYFINLLTFSLSVLCASLYSQVCGTSVSSNSAKFASNWGEMASRSSASTNCINVQFHVVRNSNGTVAFAAATANDIIDYLNSEFNQHDIFFRSIGTNFINNTAFVSIDSSSEAQNLTGQNNNSNALNIYLVNNLWMTAGGTVAGTALDIPSINLVIRNESAINSIMAHEAGHCLGLYHTHETAFGTENTNGNNCITAGDKICDTPADPNLLGNTLSCIYNGPSGYTPLVDNFMSYAPANCTDSFTQGQENWMRGALNNSSILQNIKSTQCDVPQLNGSSSMCWPNTTTLTLSNPIGTVNWNVTYPLSITSSSNTSVTVKGVSQTASGTGTITATMDNNVVRTASVTAYGQANSSTTSISVYSNGSSYIDATVNGGSGNTPYYWYLNNSFAFTTTTRTASFYYTENSVRLEVHNLNQCGQYLDQAFFTGPIPGRGYYYRASPNPTTEMITVTKNNYDIEEESYSKSDESFDQTETILTLYDFNNRIKSRKVFRGNDMNMDVSTLNPGIYILEIVSDKIKEQHKIVIE